MLDVLVVLQSHTKSSARKDERFCKASKLEVSTRCFKSLINTINWARNQQTTIPVNYRLIVLDDHSDEEFLDLVKQTIKTSTFEIELEHLENGGIMPSILRSYEIGKERGSGLVYFAQDDYLYYESCLWEMIDVFFHATELSKHNVCIFPYDHPLRYSMLVDKPYFYKVIVGAKRHWRTAYHTACCFMTTHETVLKEWDLFEAMGKHAYDEICEDETINKLFSERKYLLFTPMPSAALHMGMWSDWDPLIDWQTLWDKFPYKQHYQLPKDTKIVLNVGAGKVSIKNAAHADEMADFTEITIDEDESLNPNIVSDMMDLSMIPNNSVDAVYSAHALEHVHFHEIKICLEEWYRVLKPGGEIRIVVPNLKRVAANITWGNLLGKIYDSPVGPITALDMLYGHTPSIARGQTHMAHKTGFTVDMAQMICASLNFDSFLVFDADLEILIRIFKSVPESK